MMPNMAATPAGLPLDVPAVLARTLRLYRRHPRPFMAASAISAVPTVLLAALPWSPADAELSDLPSFLAILARLVLSLGSFFTYAVGGAAIVQLAADAVAGRPLDVPAAYRRALARLRPIACTTARVFLMLLLCLRSSPSPSSSTASSAGPSRSRPSCARAATPATPSPAAPTSSAATAGASSAPTSPS
jgi:hypothetical protein